MVSPECIGASDPKPFWHQGPVSWKTIFSQIQRGGVGEVDGFKNIPRHYIYGALYFYDYYISSTSDHQA